MTFVTTATCELSVLKTILARAASYKFFNSARKGYSKSRSNAERNGRPFVLRRCIFSIS